MLSPPTALSVQSVFPNFTALVFKIPISRTSNIYFRGFIYDDGCPDGFYRPTCVYLGFDCQNSLNFFSYFPNFPAVYVMDLTLRPCESPKD